MMTANVAEVFVRAGGAPGGVGRFSDLDSLDVEQSQVVSCMSTG